MNLFSLFRLLVISSVMLFFSTSCNIFNKQFQQRYAYLNKIPVVTEPVSVNETEQDFKHNLSENNLLKIINDEYINSDLLASNTPIISSPNRPASEFIRKFNNIPDDKQKNIKPRDQLKKIFTHKLIPKNTKKDIDPLTIILWLIVIILIAGLLKILGIDLLEILLIILFILLILLLIGYLKGYY